MRLCVDAQPLDGFVDLVALPLQVADLGQNLLRIELIFEIHRFARPFAADQVLDFGQREAELLALKDHLHPDPVAGAIIAGVPLTAGLDEPAVFVEAQGA